MSTSMILLRMYSCAPPSFFGKKRGKLPYLWCPLLFIITQSLAWFHSFFTALFWLPHSLLHTYYTVLHSHLPLHTLPESPYLLHLSLQKSHGCHYRLCYKSLYRFHYKLSYSYLYNFPYKYLCNPLHNLLYSSLHSSLHSLPHTQNNAHHNLHNQYSSLNNCHHRFPHNAPSIHLYSPQNMPPHKGNHYTFPYLPPTLSLEIPGLNILFFLYMLYK